MQEFFIQLETASFLHCCQWCPAGEPIGVVQLVHGVAEHVARYAPFAAFLTQRGYLVVGEDHPGHGKSVGEGEQLGYLAGGWREAVRGIHLLLTKTRREYPNVPYYLLGHSMGSFLVRTYLYTYHAPLAGVILSGTGWQNPALLRLGRGLAKAEALRHGEHGTSRLLQRLAFGAYNHAFAPNRTAYDWISSDSAAVDDHCADSLCGFDPTVQLYGEMFYGMAQNQKRDNLSKMQRSLPVHFLSGSLDPVGNMGQGVLETVEAFQAAGMEEVTCQLYEGMRHEPLNEVGREAVYGDILLWLQAHKKPGK